MRTITIDRAKWRSGGDSYNPTGQVGKGVTALLNKEGYMCCLGFVCRQAGHFSKTDLLDRGTPEELERYFSLLQDLNTDAYAFFDYEVEEELLRSKEKALADYDFVDNELAASAIAINDNARLTPKEREKKLTALFKRFDVKLVFTGRYS